MTKDTHRKLGKQGPLRLEYIYNGHDLHEERLGLCAQGLSASTPTKEQDNANLLIKIAERVCR